jgi:hypothetical protein
VTEAPSTNIQAPEKFQSSNSKISKGIALILLFGASLEVGAWNLELLGMTPFHAKQKIT